MSVPKQRFIHDISGSDSSATVDENADSSVLFDSDDVIPTTSKSEVQHTTDSDETVDLQFENSDKSHARDMSESHGDDCRKMSPEGDVSFKTLSPGVPFRFRKRKSDHHDVSDSDSDSISSPHGSGKRKLTNRKGRRLVKKRRKSSGSHDDHAALCDTKLSHRHSVERPNITEKFRKHSTLTSSPDQNKKTDTDSDETVDKNRSSGSHDSDVTVDLTDEDSNATADNRPTCPYGNKCYRKNPSHFEEYRHPDDDNNLSEQSGQSVSSSTEKANRESASVASRMELLEDAQPLGLFLTKVAGIGKQHNSTLAIDIKDILSTDMGNLQESAQFNYCIDIAWLVSQYPKDFRTKPLTVVHGFQREEKATIDMDAVPYDHVRLVQARLDIPYGTHHTKMMLLVYDNGMRVVIHTANLVEGDWYQKTQGVWISPLFPKLISGVRHSGDSPTHFKMDLLNYIRAYRGHSFGGWIGHIMVHDMSTARVHLIASVPGRHTGDKKEAFGHLKLRKILQQSGPAVSQVKGWPVIGQFSSVGSLGPNQESWLCTEWLSSLSAAKGLSLSNAALQLVFPSRDNVRLSLEGYAAGGALPYSINVAKKQQYLHQYFNQWRSDSRGRTRASPHIKTYMRVSPDCTHLAWFAVTSANLSKAAWGVLEKKGTQLMIRSYELGVLFLPESFGSQTSFLAMTPALTQSKKVEDKLVFPIPFDIPLTSYTKNDRPWLWDVPYKDKPDTHGNMWCPGS